MDDARYVTWERYSEDRRELAARLDRFEAKLDASISRFEVKLDALAEKVTGGRERSAEWTVRGFLVICAAGLATFLGQIFPS